MTHEEHRQRHEVLRTMLDELAADFAAHTKRHFSETTVLELLGWASEQAREPTELEEES